MPLFSNNLLKKFVVEKKYITISEFLTHGNRNRRALDFGTGFGAFLPILSATHNEVVAVDAYDDQILAANYLVDFLNLTNTRVLKVPKQDGLSSFECGEFDTILATDVLEHCRNYKAIISELKRLITKDGVLIVSLPREHLLYRILARKEMETDLERGHIYHSSKGADSVFQAIEYSFREIEFTNVWGFIWVKYYVLR